MSTHQNSAALALRPAATPASQATHIEQSRAVAEVQAMVVVAQRAPRSEAAAISAILESCKQIELAERAFFKFPRGGQTVSGPSIQLAIELARCWGNINYGLKELARDDVKAESEMLAFAWDLQTNARSDISFIVPHKRDKRGGPETLVDLRDIYENNANNGARRLREMIFRVIPPYIRVQAENACMATLQAGASEKPLALQIAEMLKAFAAIGISRERVEAKIGMKADAMTPVDLAGLRVSYRSIRNQEVTVDEEFPGGPGPSATTQASGATAKAQLSTFAGEPDAVSNAETAKTAEAQPSERYELRDDANKVEAVFATKNEWARELLVAAKDPVRGAKFLRNNHALFAELHLEIDKEIVDKLAPLFGTLPAEQENAGAAAPQAPAAPASEKAPKARAQNGSDAAKPIPLPIKDKKVQVGEYVNIINTEIGNAPTAEAVDAILTREAPNLKKFADSVGSGIRLRAQQRKTELAQQPAQAPAADAAAQPAASTPPADAGPLWRYIPLKGDTKVYANLDEMVAAITKMIAKGSADQVRAAIERNKVILQAIREQVGEDAALALETVYQDRIQAAEAEADL